MVTARFCATRCRYHVYVLVGVLLALWTARTEAQCPYGQWANISGLTSVFNVTWGSQANVLTVWDPDGAGPMPSVLVVGGGFCRVGASSNIGFWDGFAWHPMGTGIGGPGEYNGYPYVWALAAYGSGVVAAGDFSSAGGSPAANIALWDGAQWQAMGSGFNDQVDDLIVFNGQLIASGMFTASGGTPLAHIARWNGSSWVPLGAGVDGTVFSMVVHGTELVVGGHFQHAGGAAAANIARWSGSAWSAIGPGLNNSVYALAVYGGQIAAAGEFWISDGESISNVAGWDGGAWYPMGTGTGGQNACLLAHEDQIVVGGYFDDAGGVTATNIARWYGLPWPFDWEPLEGGVTYGVSGMAWYNNELVVAGGDANQLVHRWVEPTNPPVITANPLPATVTSGHAVGFTVSVAGTSAISYQWRKDGQPLSDSAHITGTHTSYLFTAAAAGTDAGLYDCVISSACGNRTSTQARLTVNPACGSADFNCDGDVGTDADIGAFFSCLSGTCPPAPCTGNADFNGDGDVGTDEDIGAFFRVLGGGGC